MAGSWLKETFEKGVDELQKLAKTGSIKIDIANLKKKRDERTKLIGNKILEMIKNGEIPADLFEPDYSYIMDMDKKIAVKEAELQDDARPQKETQTTQGTEQEPETDEKPEEIRKPEPVKPVISSDDDDEHDPHEDYINRPG